MFISTRCLYCDLRINCTRALKNCNFLVNFWVIFVAISEFMTFRLSSSVFFFPPDFFRLFDRKLRFIGLSAKTAYFSTILNEGYVTAITQK